MLLDYSKFLDRLLFKITSKPGFENQSQKWFLKTFLIRSLVFENKWKKSLQWYLAIYIIKSDF